MSLTASQEPSPNTHPETPQSAAQNVDMARVRYGAWLIGAAFVLLGVVFGVAVSQFTSAADVTAVVGSVATVTGTIIGAFFGVQVGSSGKEAAEAGRNHAEKITRAALAKMDPGAASDITNLL